MRLIKAWIIEYYVENETVDDKRGYCHWKSFKFYCILIFPIYIFFSVLGNSDIFLTGIHSMQGWTVTMRHGVTRERSIKGLKHAENLFRKNL